MGNTHDCTCKHRDQHSLSASKPCYQSHAKTKAKASKHGWVKWVIPLTGLISLVWFLVRVIPKPSRASYPCQRVAAPIASGFVVWLVGIISSTWVYRHTQRLWQRKRRMTAAICCAFSMLIIWTCLTVRDAKQVYAEFIPSDLPNCPIGVGQGIHPGRVVWAHDPNATRWDGQQGEWWDSDNTDQGTVDCMVSTTIRALTGEHDDAGAWDMLFRFCNHMKKQPDRGYQPSEKIAIKINKNQDWGTAPWESGAGMPSPHVILSVLDQLIHVAQVPAAQITVYDAGKYVGDPIYELIRANADPAFQEVRVVVVSWQAKNGRIGSQHDPNTLLHFSDPSLSEQAAELPKCVTDADYLINLALLRPHFITGMTLCAKNHFGSIFFPGLGWYASPLHAHVHRENPMGTYTPLVDIMGHPDLGGKTMLYMIDALYTAADNSSGVIRYLSFGDDWCSSLFASQDPVAIDSVGLDFMRQELRVQNYCNGAGLDNYLHEAALAHDPPSGVVYDPNGDGIGLESLGVHEHWNDANDKQYSRNLQLDEGIELVHAGKWQSDHASVRNLTTGQTYPRIQQALDMAEAGDELVVSPGIYRESIRIQGKAIVLRSEAPQDPNVVAGTVLAGGGLAVWFSPPIDASCLLSGLTITAARTAVFCEQSNPSITYCQVVGNYGHGVVLTEDSEPTILDSLIEGNQGEPVHRMADVEVVN